MKKIILAPLSIAALVGVALPLYTTSALTTTQTDTIEVTIESNCELSYGSTPHTDGDGAWGSGQTINTLSATRTNSSSTANLGSTSFTVTCNDSGGSQVTLTGNALSSGSDTISFSDATPSDTTSSWGVYNGTKWVASGDNIWSSEGSVSGSTFSATYGIGISPTQAAGTYTGTAVYTLTHPYVPPAPTNNPVNDPTANDPTNDPTNNPTNDPTNNPTNNPTNDQTSGDATSNDQTANQTSNQSANPPLTTSFAPTPTQTTSPTPTQTASTTQSTSTNQSTTSTQSTTSQDSSNDASASNTNPLGVRDSSSQTSSLGEQTESNSALATALLFAIPAAVTAAAVFFIVKQRDDNDEEEEPAA